MTAEIKYCVVCGMGSTREDWQGKDVVACDNHSKEEVAVAVAKLTKAKNGPVAVPAKNAGSTKPPAPPAETKTEPTPTS